MKEATSQSVDVLYIRSSIGDGQRARFRTRASGVCPARPGMAKTPRISDNAKALVATEADPTRFYAA